MAAPAEHGTRPAPAGRASPVEEPVITAEPVVHPAAPPAPRVRERDRAVSAYAELSRQVKERGLLARRRGYYAVRISAAVVAAAALVVGVVLLGDSWWQLLLAAALGVLGTQFAFLGHDGAHRQVFDSSARNEWAARLFACLGAGLSYGWWMNKHSRHHAAPNQVGKDTDIDSRVVAFHPEEADRRRGLWAAVTRRQGWFFLPLLLLSGANLHVDSVKILTRRAPVKGRWADAGFIVLHWAVVRLGAAARDAAGQGRGVRRGAARGLRPLHGGRLRAQPHRDAHRRARRQARLPAPPGAHVAQHQRRRRRRLPHGGPEPAGRAPPVPEHAAPEPARGAADGAGVLRRPGIHYTETTLVGSYRAIISHLNEVGLRAGDPFSCPMAAQLRA